MIPGLEKQNTLYTWEIIFKLFSYFLQLMRQGDRDSHFEHLVYKTRLMMRWSNALINQLTYFSVKHLCGIGTTEITSLLFQCYFIAGSISPPHRFSQWNAIKPHLSLAKLYNEMVNAPRLIWTSYSRAGQITD